MDDSKQRKIGAILSYIIIVLNMIVSILYTPLLIKKLGQSEYGLYQYINSIIGYLSILDLGLGNAIIIYISRTIKNHDTEKTNKLFSMFLTVFTIIGIIASIIGIILYFNASSLFNESVLPQEIQTAKILLIILTLNIAISFPGSVFSNTINAHEKFIILKIVNIANILLKPILTIPLLFFGLKSISLVVVTTLLNLIVVLVNFIYCKRKLNIKFDFSKWDKKLLIEVFSYSIWIAITEIVDKINWSVDNFLIGKMINTINVSIYSIASQLNQIFISASTAISGVMLPKIAKKNEEKNNMKEMNDIWIKTGHIQLYIVGLVLSGYIIFGKYFILLWVGEEYNLAYLIGIFLMIPMLLPLIQNVASNIVRVKNKHKFMPIIYAIISLFNILISIPLINKLGAVGAALGTAISLLIGNGIIKNVYYHVSVKLDVIGFFKNMLPLMIMQFLLTIIGYLIFQFIVINNWIILFIYIFIYTIVYILITSVFLNDYEKEIINKTIKKVKKN